MTNIAYSTRAVLESLPQFWAKLMNKTFTITLIDFMRAIEFPEKIQNQPCLFTVHLNVFCTEHI